MKKTTRATKYTVSARHAHSGAVVSPNGSMVAWCGQSNGRAVAKRIANALNADAAQRKVIRDLRARLKAVTPYIELQCVNMMNPLTRCGCGECKAHRATNLKIKNWRKP